MQGKEMYAYVQIFNKKCIMCNFSPCHHSNMNLQIHIKRISVPEIVLIYSEQKDIAKITRAITYLDGISPDQIQQVISQIC